MEAAVICKVAVSAAPYAIDKPYDYLVPEAMMETAVPGVRVMVPFGRGNRSAEGMVLTRGTGVRTKKLKPLTAVLDREPVLDRAGIELALWMRQRYFCTLFEAVKTILPTGLWYQLREVWKLTNPQLDRLTADSMAASVRRAVPVLDVLYAGGGSADLETLRSSCGQQTETVLRGLQKVGLVVCETAARRKVVDRSRRMAELAIPVEEALAAVEPKRRSAPQRYEVVNLLASAGRISAADVCYFTGASMRTLRALEKGGLVAFSQEETLRLSPPEQVEPGPAIILSGEQQAAFDQILSLTEKPAAQAALLQGVTGSGKTQVYLRLVQEVLAGGKDAMVLVPEIALTPQMMRKFSSYFGGRAAMLHSGLRMTERYDQWKRIRRGEVQVVLGTRSAIFAPLRNLGMIILDEEQESSYQ